MKTNKWTLSLILFLILGLFSCSDDDDKKTGGLEGTWLVVHSQGYIKEDGVKVDEWSEASEEDDKIIFTANGKMQFEFVDEWINDTYSYKDGKISLENYHLVFSVLRLTDTELVLEVKVEVDNLVLYEKQTLRRL